MKRLCSAFGTHSCVCLKQGIGGREAPMRSTKPWNNRRFIGTFDVKNTTKGDSGRYRCIIHSEKGVGVSNYGELTIKRKRGGLGHSKRNKKKNENNNNALTNPHDLLRTAKSIGHEQEVPQIVLM